MANLANIMKRASTILRDRAGFCSLSEALRISWAVERGFTNGFETSYLDKGRLVRVMGFANSFYRAHADRIEAMRWIVAAGFKPTGSSEFGLRRYWPVSAGFSVPAITTPALRRAA